ncbi:hypothetical protein OY671_008818, partial [Metschnikowia pulcherrima]
MQLAARVRESADEDRAGGHSASAAGKYARACAYYITAERMPSHDFAPRKAAYAALLKSFADYVESSAEPCETVTIPYEGSDFPAIFSSAATQEDPCPPCMIFCNGLDSVKEMVYSAGIAQALRTRGISCSVVDQPGVGGASRTNGSTAIIDTERWAGAAIDWLQQRADVNADGIGMMGWSSGGYYAPRAAAFEKRFRLCVAWGANHEWGLVQQRRRRNEGENHVP